MAGNRYGTKHPLIKCEMYENGVAKDVNLGRPVVECSIKTECPYGYLSKGLCKSGGFVGIKLHFSAETKGLEAKIEPIKP